MPRHQTITLDLVARKRLQEMLPRVADLRSHRNSRLGRMSTMLFGVAVVSGFWFVMGFIVAGGWYPLAPALALTLAVSWLSAERIERVEKAKPIKLRLR